MSLMALLTGADEGLGSEMAVARIFHPFERRVRARGLQGRDDLVGRVPSRGELLAFPSEFEIARLIPKALLRDYPCLLGDTSGHCPGPRAVPGSQRPPMRNGGQASCTLPTQI